MLILLNANKVSGLYRNAKNNPEIIWIIKHVPNIDPKFHKRLIFFGILALIELFNNNKIWLIFLFFKIKYF